MTTENLLPLPPESGSARASAFAESFLTADDGERLRLCSAPIAKARAELLVTHGLGEHAGRYAHVAARLAERGIRVHVYDLRGHGRSAGRRGDVENYDVLLHDLRRVYREVAASGAPVFLFGHSMGGQIVLRFLEGDVPAVRGAVVASPWLRLAFSPPRWKLRLARVVMRFFPHHSQPTGMRLDRLTRDEAHVEAMPDRALMHHRISARMFFAVHAASERAMAEAERVRTPLLLLHGDADPVTCCRTTAEFHERVSVRDKALRIFPGGLHELHNDVIREDVLREVGDWVVARW